VIVSVVIDVVVVVRMDVDNDRSEGNDMGGDGSKSCRREVVATVDVVVVPVVMKVSVVEEEGIVVVMMLSFVFRLGVESGSECRRGYDVTAVSVDVIAVFVFVFVFRLVVSRTSLSSSSSWYESSTYASSSSSFSSSSSSRLLLMISKSKVPVYTLFAGAEY
jgi:hypothetical protein